MQGRDQFETAGEQEVLTFETGVDDLSDRGGGQYRTLDHGTEEFGGPVACEAPDTLDGQGAVAEQGQRHRGAAAGDLLEGHDEGDRSCADSSIFFRDCDPEESELPSTEEKIAIEVVRLVARRHRRGELSVGKLGDCIADHLGFFGQEHRCLVLERSGSC